MGDPRLAPLDGDDGDHALLPVVPGPDDVCVMVPGVRQALGRRPELLLLARRQPEDHPAGHGKRAPQARGRRRRAPRPAPARRRRASASGRLARWPNRAPLGLRLLAGAACSWPF